MKVILATGIFYPDLGGPAIHARKIAEALQAEDFEVVVITYSKKSKEQFPYPVYNIPRRYPLPIRVMLYFFRVFWELRNAQIIYAFDLTSAGIPSFVLAKFFFKKFFMRIGGDPIWERVVEKGERFISLDEYYKQGLYKKDKPVLYKVLRYLLKHTDHITVYSNGMKNLYTKYFSVLPSRITIIPNPCERTEVANRELGGMPVLLFAGRFVAYKNLRLCIETFVRLRRKIGRGRFIMIGNGPEKEALQKYIHDMNALSYIEIKEPMPQSELFKLIREARVCLAPAITELNPNFILESLSLGKPVLISQGNGLSVSLPSEFVFNPFDSGELERKLEFLFEPLEYGKAVDTISNIDMNFGWKDVVQKHIELIKNSK